MAIMMFGHTLAVAKAVLFFGTMVFAKSAFLTNRKS